MSKIVDKQKEHFANNCDKLLWYLRKNNRAGITTMEAMTLKELRMTNLPRRILDLKEQGYEFIDVWEESEDGSNRWKRYFLLKSPKGSENEKHHRNDRPTEKG